MPLDDKIQTETIVFAPTAQFDIDIIRNDDRLTCYYTGMPTFDSFMGLVEYFIPKAKDLISWNERYTKDTCIIGHHFARTKISDIIIANKLYQF